MSEPAATNDAVQSLPAGTTITIPEGLHLALATDSTEQAAEQLEAIRRDVRRRFWMRAAIIVPVAIDLAFAYGLWSAWDVGEGAMDAAALTVMVVFASVVAARGLWRGERRGLDATGLCMLLAIVATAAFTWGGAQGRDVTYPATTIGPSAGSTVGGAGWYCARACYGGPVPLQVASKHGAVAGQRTAAWTCDSATCFGGPLPAPVAKGLGAHPTSAATSPGKLAGLLVVDRSGTWSLSGAEDMTTSGVVGDDAAAQQPSGDLTLQDLANGVAGGADATTAGASDPNAVPTPDGSTPAVVGTCDAAGPC